MTRLEALFEGVVTAGEAPVGKPSPEPYLYALRTYGLPPSECLAIEDGESGLQSARAAGLEVVLIHTDLEISGVPHVLDCENLAKLLLP